MANTITFSRILFSIALLFCYPFSTAFYILYLMAGLTDMIDGVVARKTNTVSDFGSKLDTVADGFYFVIVLIKIIPLLYLPIWLMIWIGIIGFMKLWNMLYTIMKQKKFIAVHSVMNKIAGLLLFIYPLTLKVMDGRYGGVFVCGIATIAAVWEWCIIHRRRY